MTSVEETSLTFIENAFIKARRSGFGHRSTGHHQRFRLGGGCARRRAGIYSANYAGDGLGAEQSAWRPVFTVSWFLYVIPDVPTLLVCHGSWSGEIIASRPAPAVLATILFYC
ncbi:MAG: dITP/XTP pyrophosphatase [Sodalis sp.]|nr:MAG: dITP/XTP pyrophosphatase [Sodalis sp.]